MKKILRCALLAVAAGLFLLQPGALRFNLTQQRLAALVEQQCVVGRVACDGVLKQVNQPLQYLQAREIAGVALEDMPAASKKAPEA